MEGGPDALGPKLLMRSIPFAQPEDRRDSFQGALHTGATGAQAEASVESRPCRVSNPDSRCGPESPCLHRAPLCMPLLAAGPPCKKNPLQTLRSEDVYMSDMTKLSWKLSAELSNLKHFWMRTY